MSNSNNPSDRSKHPPGIWRGHRRLAALVWAVRKCADEYLRRPDEANLEQLEVFTALFVEKARGAVVEVGE